MKNLESGCIILKEKEYDDLVKQANDNKQKEIKISWNGTYSMGSHYNSLQIAGDFILKGGLFNQISNINKIFNDKIKLKSEAILAEGVEKGINVGSCDTKKKFKELPWYKRLFFDEKYIK